MFANQQLRFVYRDKYERIKIRTRRPNTKRLYRITLKFFNLFLGREALISDLNDDTVSAFASWRIDGGLSKKTVNRDLANLLAIWRWLHTRGYVSNWPQVEMESLPERIPVALMEDEIGRVMTAIDTEPLRVGNIPAPVFWRAVMLVIWDTAERIGAIMSLKWEHVDLRGRWIRFDAESRKGAVADNVLPLAADTCTALRKLHRHGEASVFPWPYHPTYIYNRLGRIMRRAGLPNNRLYKFHVVRKSVASHYEAAGGNATSLLKHSSRKVTMAYLDPRIVKPVSPIDLLFRPGGGGNT